jgi:hypothetical protein
MAPGWVARRLTPLGSSYVVAASAEASRLETAEGDNEAARFGLDDPL